MGFRDPHAILLNRSSILVVTSVGVALLTLSYVLGVQVGKQSAALQRPASKGSGEDLKALPAPILDQIKSFDSGRDDAPAERDAPKDTGADARPDLKPAAESKPEAKPGTKPKGDPLAKAAAPSGTWTLQLLSTPDRAEADRIAAKAKAAGFPTQVVKDRGDFKVRWKNAGAKLEVDAMATKMKGAGFKPFAVPVE